MRVRLALFSDCSDFRGKAGTAREYSSHKQRSIGLDFTRSFETLRPAAAREFGMRREEALLSTVDY
jgi:hypothetical protein